MCNICNIYIYIIYIYIYICIYIRHDCAKPKTTATLLFRKQLLLF